jgi:hypothetical protein
MGIAFTFLIFLPAILIVCVLAQQFADACRIGKLRQRADGNRSAYRSQVM